MTYELDKLIFHIDMDAFFPSVEQLLVPRLRGQPVVVGSGVIASCSYEARRLGLHVGMALHTVRRVCPQAVILAGDYQIYRCFAEHVWQICRQYTFALQTYLDEAYGDVGSLAALHGGPEPLGRKLQQHIAREVGLPVSIGLAENRMLAKMASHAAKPRGVLWLGPVAVEGFLRDLPVRRLPGVGPKTAGKLRDFSVETIGQLAGLSREFLRAMLGLRGEVLYERACGRDIGAIVPEARPKTISRETTFHQPTCRREEILGMLFYLTERAMRTARGLRLAAGAVETTLRYDDWKHREARRTLDCATADDHDVFAVVQRQFETMYTRRVALRHVGVVLGGFVCSGDIGRLFEPASAARRRDLAVAIDEIRDRWGHAAVVKGKSLELLGKLSQNDYGFVLRTPSLTK